MPELRRLNHPVCGGLCDHCRQTVAVLWWIHNWGLCTACMAQHCAAHGCTP